MQQTPIFTKTFDCTTTLLEMTNHFPRSQRFFVTKRLLDSAFNFQEFLIEANSCRGSQRMIKLNMADSELNKLRLYLRMSYRWNWLSKGQYAHVARQIQEIGNLLGGWKKVTR
ncbi:23S rRNA-associated protein [Candidatus Magnetomorum sp. HK-1]|nr:23S rRNA-associated protein [Candidatus Magnetomorum sp. HK-1]